MGNDGSERIGPGRTELTVRRWMLGFLPFAGMALLWFILSHFCEIQEVFLPRLETMPGAVWGMFTEEAILSDVLISCYRVVAGFLIAVALATPLGILMAYSSRQPDLRAHRGVCPLHAGAGVHPDLHPLVW